MEIIIVYALVFVIGLIGFELILRQFFGSTRKSSEINHRLEKLKSSQDHEKTYGDILLKRGVDTEKTTILTGDWVMKTYAQTGIRLSVKQRYGYSLLWLLVSFAIGFLFVSHDPFKLFLFTTALFFGGLLGLIWRLRNKRIAKFILQLPEAIDIIVRSISAGHPLNTAISLVSREMIDPIGSEFGLITDQLMYGADLDSAMIDVYYRVGAEELKLLVVTLSVQQGTGGNLREVLENLSSMIRARTLMKSKIRAITAEGRITAIIMAVFPFGLFLMINTLAPGYFNALYESGWANTVFTVLGVLMVIGMIILNRLVRFDF